MFFLLLTLVFNPAFYCEILLISVSYFEMPLQDLGSSAGSKRPTCVILIKPHQDYQDAYDECLDEVSSLPKPL